MVVAVTGATGTTYGIHLLQALRDLDVESHLVVSKAGSMTRAYETDYSASDLRDLADHSYAHTDIAAPISSGSFRTMGMVIAPCSVRTMSDIAHGTTSCLTSRAADVALKERRRLVLMVRETPLHSGHLRSMLTLSEIGAIIAPPVPAFYTCPETLDDMVRHSIGRVLDLFDLDTSAFPRWGADVDAWPTEALDQAPV